MSYMKIKPSLLQSKHVNAVDLLMLRLCEAITIGQTSITLPIVMTYTTH